MFMIRAKLLHVIKNKWNVNNELHVYVNIPRIHQMATYRSKQSYNTITRRYSIAWRKLSRKNEDEEKRKHRETEDREDRNFKMIVLSKLRKESSVGRFPRIEEKSEETKMCFPNIPSVIIRRCWREQQEK